MNSVRHLGSGLFYAVVSVVLVVGGLSLALAEGGGTAPSAADTPTGTPVPSSATPIPATQTVAVVPPSSEPAATPSSMPQAIIVTATSPALLPTATLRPASTATRAAYATAMKCGAPYGWIKNYYVQAGDTLYHISTLYRTTVGALQAANCLQSTFIFPGELLWVPNVPTITPGVTFIPTFTTPTTASTEPVTLTVAPNFTAIPTETPVTPDP